MSYRETEQELRYYGADLNKYCHDFLTKEMTVNNIDLVLHKQSKNEIKVIECKNKGERESENKFKAQEKLLRRISEVFDLANCCSDLSKEELDELRKTQPKIVDRIKTLKYNEVTQFSDPFKGSVHYAEGTAPFEDGIKLTSLKDGTETKLNQEEMNDFLEFKT